MDRREFIAGAAAVAMFPVTVESREVATGTTTIPVHKSAPQITEGDEYMSVTIDAAPIKRVLRIDVAVYGSNAGNSGMIVALFRNAESDAIAAVATNQRATMPSQLTQILLTHRVDVEPLEEVMFKVRAGCISAGTFIFNGTKQGGKIVRSDGEPSSMTVTEFDTEYVSVISQTTVE